MVSMCFYMTYLEFKLRRGDFSIVQTLYSALKPIVEKDDNETIHPSSYQSKYYILGVSLVVEGEGFSFNFPSISHLVHFHRLRRRHSFPHNHRCWV